MIIKKHQAESVKPLPPEALMGSGHATRPGTLHRPAPDPYHGELTAEDFRSGRLVDRRGTDRRQGFRRIEDQALLSRAEEEAHAIRERAARQGQDEGVAQGQDVIEALHEVIHDFFHARESALLAVADELGAMAVDIAEQILKTEVTCDPELVLGLVKQTIAKVGREQKSILIKVNPIDEDTLLAALKARPMTRDDVDVQVSPEESVDPGSCMVETRAGLIDARFSTQLAVLKRLVTTGGTF